MAVLALMILLAIPGFFLVATIINPQWAWRTFYSWQYANPDANEPSDTAYLVERAGAIFMLIILGVGGLQILSWQMRDAAEEKRSAQERVEIQQRQEVEERERRAKEPEFNRQREEKHTAMEQLRSELDVDFVERTSASERQFVVFAPGEVPSDWVAPTSVIRQGGQQSGEIFNGINTYLRGRTPETDFEYKDLSYLLTEGTAIPTDDDRDSMRNADFILVYQEDKDSELTIKCGTIEYTLVETEESVTAAFKTCPRETERKKSGSNRSDEGLDNEKRGVLILGIELEEHARGDSVPQKSTTRTKQLVGPDGTPIPVSVIPPPEEASESQSGN